MVYRVDTRPPDEVFKSGFVPRGDDLDLPTHVQGANWKNTGFVATTDDPHLVPRIMHDVGLHQGVQAWLYKIRASDNFFYVPESLTWIATHNPPTSGRTQLSQGVYAAYSHQREWVAAGGIPRAQIEEATRLQPANAHEPVRRNPWYFRADTQAAKQLFTDDVEAKIRQNRTPIGDSSWDTVFCDAPISGRPCGTKRPARPAKSGAVAKKPAATAQGTGASADKSKAETEAEIEARSRANVSAMVQATDAERDRAGALQKEILADKDFMASLPKRTDKPMSAADIDKTASLLKTKIGSMRTGGNVATSAAGLGTTLYNAMTRTDEDDEKTSFGKTRNIASLIPVVGQAIGLGVGIKDKDTEAIAVNTIALGAVLVAVALPAIGELVGVGLVAYGVVKSLIAWWKGMDAEGKACLTGTAAASGSPISLFAYVETHPQCRVYYVKWLDAAGKYFENAFWPTPPAPRDVPGGDYGSPPPKVWWRNPSSLPEPTPDGLRTTASAAYAASRTYRAAEDAATSAYALKDKAVKDTAAKNAKVMAAWYGRIAADMDAAANDAATKYAIAKDAAIKDAGGNLAIVLNGEQPVWSVPIRPCRLSASCTS